MKGAAHGKVRIYCTARVQLTPVSMAAAAAGIGANAIANTERQTQLNTDGDILIHKHRIDPAAAMEH